MYARKELSDLLGELTSLLLQFPSLSLVTFPTLKSVRLKLIQLLLLALD